MFIGGIVGTSQNDVFEQCASNVTNSIVDDEFKMYEQNRTREMNANYNNLNSKSSKTAEEINESAKDYIEDQQKAIDSANNALAEKEATETAIRNSSGILSNTFVSLQNIMKNFSDAAKSFVNSNAVKKL
jgi:seryl-tRNA synthetase